MQAKRTIGILSGTALRNLEGLTITREWWHHTGFTRSVWVIEGVLEGRTVFLIPRHGRNHERLPHETDFLGNLVALKQLGVTDVLAVSAMGGLAPGYESGMLVFPDVTMDKTHGRSSTIFGDGIVGHVSRERAVCPLLHRALVEVAGRLGIAHQPKGDLVVINGPQFSSGSESRVNRMEGHHVVGMNSEPEAKLARELGLHYAIVGQITDLDNPPSESRSPGVDQQEVSRRSAQMGTLASRLIREMARHLFFDEGNAPACTCTQSLLGTILTDPRSVGDGVKARFSRIFSFEEIPAEWFAR